MQEGIKKIFTTSMITSFVFVIIGIILFIEPQVTLNLISYIIGGIILLNGIINIVKYFTNKIRVFYDFGLIYGILSTIIGFMFIFNPEFLASVIPLVLGIWIIINSIIKLQVSLNLKVKSSQWFTTFIISLLNLLLGILFVFNPFSGAVVITKIIGVFLFIYSVLDIVECLMMRKKLDDGVEFIK